MYDNNNNNNNKSLLLFTENPKSVLVAKEFKKFCLPNQPKWLKYRQRNSSQQLHMILTEVRIELTIFSLNIFQIEP
jgi:hypothetical protein